MREPDHQGALRTVTGWEDPGFASEKQNKEAQRKTDWKHLLDWMREILPLRPITKGVIELEMG